MLGQWDFPERNLFHGHLHGAIENRELQSGGICVIVLAVIQIDVEVNEEVYHHVGNPYEGIHFKLLKLQVRESENRILQLPSTVLLAEFGKLTEGIICQIPDVCILDFIAARIF